MLQSTSNTFGSDGAIRKRKPPEKPLPFRHGESSPWSLLGASETDLVALLREVQQFLPVPIRGVISGGRHAIRNAIRAVLPDVPHQLCHFHYLREAAKPVYEADRHEKTTTAILI